MIGGKDPFFGMVPDINGDGKSDLLDFLILREILRDEDDPDSDPFRDLFDDDELSGINDDETDLF